MDHFFTELTLSLAGNGNILLYLFLFGFAILENLVPPVPGDTVTIFGAFLVGTGKLNFPLVLIVTTVGSTIGFVFLYYIARKFGERIIASGKIRWLSEKSTARARGMIGRFGYLIIAANRFLPGVRSVISISAGLLEMKPVPVITLSFVSAALWNLACISIGYALGSNWAEFQARATTYASRYNLIAGITVFALILTAVIMIRRKSRKAGLIPKGGKPGGR
jgi:membrane protein DedA with SNARE-associated domain